MADASPWIALASSLCVMAAAVRLLLWLADRPPPPRRRTRIGPDLPISLPANRNEPDHAARPAVGH